MSYIYLGIPVVILLLVTICILIFHFRKKAIIRKVNCMTVSEKKELLDSFAGPAGYRYEPSQDIFTAKIDAPQKSLGYTSLYDLSAPYFKMVFDYETVYFDYRGRTWLIEMWKGQYGINTGCELGIYYADEIIPPEKYHATLFHAVDARDMPDIFLKLNRHCKQSQSGQSGGLSPQRRRAGNDGSPEGCGVCCSLQYSQLGHMQGRHWWLTIFRMGCFTKPSELFVNTAIRFPDHRMMAKFVESFQRTLPDTAIKTGGLSVYFTFDQSRRKYSLFRRIVRRMALLSCRFYCRWFNYLTRPFEKSGDKLVYAYCYLPLIIKRMFRQGSKKR